jgi:hypothetical protein
MSNHADAGLAQPDQGAHTIRRFLACVPGLAIWSVAAFGAARWIGGLMSGSVQPGVDTNPSTLYIVWGSVILGAIVAYMCAYLTVVRTMRLPVQWAIFLAGCVGWLMVVGD